MSAFWNNRYVRILTILLAVQAVLFYTASHGDSRPLRQPLSAFPEKLPGWQMSSQNVVDKDTIEVLKADDVVSRFYVRDSITDFAPRTPEASARLLANTEEFFVAYFSTQQQGQSPHSPKNCLPGAGWQQTETGELTVPIPELNTPITINKYIISKGTQTSVVLYWYQSHGRVVANEFAAKFYLVSDSMRYHRSDTAIVRVVAPVLHDDVASALKSATDFVQAVFPAVYHFLPS
jgi:EpsI family protein